MKFQSFNECVAYIRADAYRYNGNYKWISLLRLYFVTIGFRYCVWMRLCAYLSSRRFLFPFYLFAILRIKQVSYRSGIQISWKTKIGKGFYIGHFGTIVVSPDAIIGNNVNISQGVCIGAANRGVRKGAATIGDCVYFAPGCKVVGAVKIGNNVCVGANAVVTKDVADYACVGGVPAKILSFDGVSGYINNIIIR